MNIKSIIFSAVLPLAFFLPPLTDINKAFSMPPVKNQDQKKKHKPTKRQLHFSDKKPQTEYYTPKRKFQNPIGKKLRFSGKKDQDTSVSPKQNNHSHISLDNNSLAPALPDVPCCSLSPILAIPAAGQPGNFVESPSASPQLHSFTAKAFYQRTSTPKRKRETLPPEEESDISNLTLNQQEPVKKTAKRVNKSKQVTCHKKGTTSKKKSLKKPSVHIVSQETLQEIHKQRRISFKMSPIEHPHSCFPDNTITDLLAELNLFSPTSPDWPSASPYLDDIQNFHDYLCSDEYRKKVNARFKVPFTVQLTEAGSHLKDFEVLKNWIKHHHKLQRINQQLSQELKDPNTSGISFRDQSTFKKQSSDIIQDCVRLLALRKGILAISSRAKRAVALATELKSQLEHAIQQNNIRLNSLDEDELEGLSEEELSGLYASSYKRTREKYKGELAKLEYTEFQADTIKSLLDFFLFNRLLSELEFLERLYSYAIDMDLHHTYRKTLNAYLQKINMATVLTEDSFTTKEAIKIINQKLQEVRKLIDIKPQATSTPKLVTTGDKEISITYKGKKSKLLLIR